MIFAESLARIRASLVDAEHAQNPAARYVSLRVEDLQALLRDHERLDDQARLVYEAHVKQLRAACNGMQDQIDKMQGALALTLTRKPEPMIQRRRDF